MVNHSRVGEPRGPGTRGARLNPKKCEQCSGEVLGLIPRQGEMGEGNEAGQGSNREGCCTRLGCEGMFIDMDPCVCAVSLFSVSARAKRVACYCPE